MFLLWKKKGEVLGTFFDSSMREKLITCTARSLSEAGKKRVWKCSQDQGYKFSEKRTLRHKKCHHLHFVLIEGLFCLFPRKQEKQPESYSSSGCSLRWRGAVALKLAPIDREFPLSITAVLLIVDTRFVLATG